MSVHAAFDALPVAFETPIALAAFPFLLATVWFLVVRGTSEGDLGRRARLGLFGSRLVIVGLLVTAAAGPYTVAERETPGDPHVSILVDRSASMAVVPSVADRLARGIEDAGVPVTTTTIAAGNRSAIGDGIVANIDRDGSLVVLSDGRVTEGRSIDSAAELARSLNATISTVELAPDRTECYVDIAGPSKTTTGVENRFAVRIRGANLDATPVTVSIDGEQVTAESVAEPGAIDVRHTFEEPGSHRVTARLDCQDTFAVNNVAYKSIRVTQQPRILSVSQRDYPLRAHLTDLYNVTTATSVPPDLSEYYAVVLHDVPAGEIGAIEALQRFVINGNGLVVVGGDHAYDRGGYGESTIGSMLPVEMGAAQGERASIVLTIDISGSAAAGMRTQKGLALDVLEQLGDHHHVGIVAFNDQAYRVADLQRLGESRPRLEDRIRRLEAGGRTGIDAGLVGASQLLGDRTGTVILLSDGRDDPTAPTEAARRLGARNHRVITIGVGRVINENLLEVIAAVSDGVYYRANETSRLRILFGDESRRFAGRGLTIVDGSHFITAGVTTEARLPSSNEVSVKRGGTFLVATAAGTPAVSAWRYGLGRVVSITAYGADGGVGGLLSAPDSLLVSRSVNWAIGDPERKRTGITNVRDTRIGEPTTITHTGETRPVTDDLTFRRAGPDTYRATVTPSATGFHTVLDAEYAVNYPREYAGFGTDQALVHAVETTNGRVFAPTAGAEIAAFAARQSTARRTVRDDWTWAALLGALALFLLEVSVRRLRAYRGIHTP